MIFKLSRGKICVANFIPPANGARLGSYFCVKSLTLAKKHCLKKEFKRTAWLFISYKTSFDPTLFQFISARLDGTESVKPHFLVI